MKKIAVRGAIDLGNNDSFWVKINFHLKNSLSTHKLRKKVKFFRVAFI